MATRKERAKIAVQASGAAMMSGSASLKDKLDAITASSRGKYVDPSVGDIIDGNSKKKDQK